MAIHANEDGVMSVGIWLFVAINAAMLAVLLWRLRALKTLTQSLTAELEALRCLPHDEAPELALRLGSGQRPVLVMDILNPMELATQQSWFADKFGSLAPGMISKLVYQQAVKMTIIEMQKHGVQAQVSVHRVV
jgi:hypothetical protein